MTRSSLIISLLYILLLSLDTIAVAAFVQPRWPTGQVSALGQSKQYSRHHARQSMLRQSLQLKARKPPSGPSEIVRDTAIVFSVAFLITYLISDPVQKVINPGGYKEGYELQVFPGGCNRPIKEKYSYLSDCTCKHQGKGTSIQLCKVDKVELQRVKDEYDAAHPEVVKRRELLKEREAQRKGLLQ